MQQASWALVESPLIFLLFLPRLAAGGVAVLTGSTLGLLAVVAFSWEEPV